ncbi:hypothetical protein HaLaN_23560 [Haematococcus lacustris]|uniref:Uncharacterized protein n=1 Tax=Haematococcus lacustris TaxID=44745 RepID=A0A6A0A1Q2_HAELA|nr:hypothetical protein HaLaN_23560 [Haematococcus lacustris]
MLASKPPASSYNHTNNHPGNVACSHNNTAGTIMTTGVKKRVKERTTSKYRNIIARSQGDQKWRCIVSSCNRCRNGCSYEAATKHANKYHSTLIPANSSQDSQEPSQSPTEGAGPSTAANEAMDVNRWVPNTGLQASPGDAAEVVKEPAAEESPNQEAEAEEIPAANTQPEGPEAELPVYDENKAWEDWSMGSYTTDVEVR